MNVHHHSLVFSPQGCMLKQYLLGGKNGLNRNACVSYVTQWDPIFPKFESPLGIKLEIFECKLLEIAHFEVFH